MQINVLEYLEATAARVPSKAALTDGDGSLTFGELRERAHRIRGAIARRTTARNEPVAVFLPKSKECVVAFAGILYSGNCYAPLDVKSPEKRQAGLLAQLQPTLVITNRALEGSLRSMGFDGPTLCVEDLAAADGDPAGLPVTIDTDPVYIIHTSGSTGVPKGVVISHRGVIDYISWATECYGVTGEDTIGNQAPFHFDNSTLDIYLSWRSGATLVIIPETLFLFPAKLIDYVRAQGVRMIFWVPSVMAAVANMDILSQTALPPFSKILFAGEVMQNKHLNYWRRWFPNALFSNLYGPTEITVDCTYYIVDREFADDEPLPIGFPCRNSDVLILNDRNELSGAGERGELCVRGTSLAMGYWNDPQKTAAVFVQNPLNRHYPEPIYRTGDIVYRNERGEIMFCGRKDSQIKHLGYRIELSEIEYRVLGIEQVANACVLYNDDRKEITLFYQTRGGEALTTAVIRQRLLEVLPKYMVPTVFHELAEMPRNANGKIDRKELSAQYAQAAV